MENIRRNAYDAAFKMSGDHQLVTISMKNKKRMDANTCAWQWRSSCVKKYSRYTERLYHCSKIGFDFNVGSQMHKKLDLKMVTNGVILEMCDFAKMVNKSKIQFATHILENNFDLGLDNEQQRSEFSSRILHKVKDLMRKPRDEHGVFTLCDILQCAVCTNTLEDALNTDDTKDEDQCGLEEIDGPQTNDINDLDEGLRLHSNELKADVGLPSFPHCEGIGLNIEVGSKQSLDPTSLTNGVMLELVHFARFITSYSSIVLGLLEHNFELDIKCPNLKSIVWLKILALLKRRKQLIDMFKDESFCFYTESEKSEAENPLYHFRDIPKKRQPKKRALSAPRGGGTKMCKAKKIKKDIPSQNKNTCSWDSDHASDLEHSYMCPLDSDEASNIEGTDNENPVQDSCSNTLRPSELVCLSTHTPFLTNSDPSFDVNSPFAGKSNKRKSAGDKKQTQIPGNVPDRCLAEEEDMQVERDMWKLRSKRVKQIVEDQEYCAFHKAREVGIEFNVGFGPKQKISINSLTTALFFEIVKFALALNSSQQEFIMEILEYNFDLDLHNKIQRKMFAQDLMIKVRQLKNRKYPEKSSREIFELPGLVSLVNMAKANMGNVGTELETLSRMNKCTVGPVRRPDSHAEATEQSVNHHPFCEEIELKLHVKHHHPKKKLELYKLTSGAMSEVMNFAERLCGTFQEIFVDVLQHNFDFDSQNGNSDPTTDILLRVPIVVEQQNLMRCFPFSPSFKLQWSLKPIWEFGNPPPSNAQSNDSVQVPFIDQNVEICAHAEQENELDLWLWRLRANQMQRILSVPHLEHCPLYSFSKCKKVGIDFNIGSGVKQSLDPRLLTNGVMVEIDNFASELQAAQKYFITEILEYNFDLERFDLKNDLNRSIFAQQLFLKVRAAVYRRSQSLMMKPFELPDLRCVEGSPKLKFCPRCCRDESGPGHMIHPHLPATVSGEANCTAKQPAKDSSSISPTLLKSIMHKYHRCRLSGLSLCMEKDQPSVKLDMRLLTRGIVREVAGFAKTLCGTKNQLVNDIIKHNWFGSQSKDINHAAQFTAQMTARSRKPSWFNERFVAQPNHHRDSGHTAKGSKVAAKNEKAGDRASTGQVEEEEMMSVCHHADL
ncbi:uncharacterized protein LOC114849153 isoform X2 [Betta splendens]|uniref:Uncharacterized protein LOC114849153 isoform X2 n=1 Tax=Betta splendens TaxID=158456 RepID=A0A6P7LPH3_BETSP|nr:uncharacterized protein LOC114849153 isoform X2 [Betta splendens]